MSDRTSPERKRRHKIRQALGNCFAYVDVPRDVVSKLIDQHIIAPAESKSPRKLGEAITKYLTSHAIGQTSTR